MSRNLLFVSSGDSPLVFQNHRLFEISGLDVVVAFYGDDEERYRNIRDKAAYVKRIKGTKFNNFIYLVRSGVVSLSEYDYIGLFDDDLLLNVGYLDDLFDEAAKSSSDICTPSHHPSGKISFNIMSTKLYKGNHRRVNFIEMTCPIFRSKLLSDFINGYRGALDGWGVDWCYMNAAVRSGYKNFFVFDNFVIYNLHDSEKKGIRELSKFISSEEEVCQYRSHASLFKVEEWDMTTYEKLNSGTGGRYTYRFYIVSLTLIKKLFNYIARKLAL